MNSERPFALGSFSDGGARPFLGLVLGDNVIRVCDAAPAIFPHDMTLFALLQNWKENFAILCSALTRDIEKPMRLSLENLLIHAPLPDARQVFCTGANYRKHVIEMITAMGLGAETQNMSEDERHMFAQAYVERQLSVGAPFVFMKTVTSIAGPRDDLRLPRFSAQADWELELGVILGAPAFQVSRDKALDYVAGYMIVNDVTARDKVRRTDPGAIGLDWLASKGAPGFLPTGPFFVPSLFIANPYELQMRLSVNGETMQDERTSDMTFDIAHQIEFISTYARMLPGDILCTGSPAGNGIVRNRFLKHGDLMEAEIEGLGKQTVRCIAPDAGEAY